MKLRGRKLYRRTTCQRTIKNQIGTWSEWSVAMWLCRMYLPARHPVAFDVDVLLRGTYQIRGPSTSSFRHRPVGAANRQYMALGCALKNWSPNRRMFFILFRWIVTFSVFVFFFSERHSRHELLRCRHRTMWLSFRSSCTLNYCLKDLGLWKSQWKRWSRGEKSCT